jgi:hypothetical protein
MGVACSREAMSDDDTDERDYFLSTGQDNVYIPRDVTRVRVHPSVKKIKARAFQGCTWLRTAILNDGLEEIGGGSFSNCALTYPPQSGRSIMGHSVVARC